jgi:hypothetical protein
MLAAMRADESNPRSAGTQPPLFWRGHLIWFKFLGLGLLAGVVVIIASAASGAILVCLTAIVLSLSVLLGFVIVLGDLILFATDRARLKAVVASKNGL